MTAGTGIDALPAYVIAQLDNNLCMAGFWYALLDRIEQASINLFVPDQQRFQLVRFGFGY